MRRDARAGLTLADTLSVLMGDGSVRFVTDDIALNVWVGAATFAGREPTTLDQ